MRFIAFIAALVIFIITAICAFFFKEADVELRTLVGLLAVGLAALTIAFVPAPPAGWRS